MYLILLFSPLFDDSLHHLLLFLVSCEVVVEDLGRHDGQRNDEQHKEGGGVQHTDRLLENCRKNELYCIFWRIF